MTSTKRAQAAFSTRPRKGLAQYPRKSTQGNLEIQSGWNYTIDEVLSNAGFWVGQL